MRSGIVLPFPREDGGPFDTGSARLPLRGVFCGHLLSHEDPSNLAEVLKGLLRREESQQKCKALNLVLVPRSRLNVLYHIQDS